MMVFDNHVKKSKKCMILFMAVLLMFSVGCGQKEGGEADTGDQQEKEVKKLAQYSDVGGTVWSESWECESSCFAKINVQTDALVIVPAVEKMAVAEVKEFTFDKENFQMVAQGIFGSSVSSYDENNEKLPEDMLKKKLEETERELEFNGQEMEEAEQAPGAYSDQEKNKIVENVQKGREDVKRLTELLENTSNGEDFVLEPAGDYQSDHYVGEWNGMEYLLNFKEEHEFEYGDGVRKILFTPRREKDVWPEELKEMEEVTKRVASDSRKPDNEAGYEEAQKAAEDFLKKSGFSDTLCSDSALLLWDGTPSEGSGQQAKTVQKGYRFTYVTGVDGLTFWTPNSFGDGYSWSKDMNEYPAYTQIELDVADAGVICAEWEYPIMTTSVTSDVKLLPFDEIKNIIRKSIGECVDKYDAPSDKKEKEKAKEEVYDVTIKRLWLGYFRLKDPSREGYYSYVPVWQANECIVNAIDGTLIDLPW